MFVLLQKKILNASLLVSKHLNVKYGICESCSSNIEKGIDFSFIFSWKIEQNTNIAFFDQPFPEVYIKQLLLKNKWINENHTQFVTNNDFFLFKYPRFDGIYYPQTQGHTGWLVKFFFRVHALLTFFDYSIICKCKGCLASI